MTDLIQLHEHRPFLDAAVFTAVVLILPLVAVLHATASERKAPERVFVRSLAMAAFLGCVVFAVSLFVALKVSNPLETVRLGQDHIILSYYQGDDLLLRRGEVASLRYSQGIKSSAFRVGMTLKTGGTISLGKVGQESRAHEIATALAGPLGLSRERGKAQWSLPGETSLP